MTKEDFMSYGVNEEIALTLEEIYNLEMEDYVVKSLYEENLKHVSELVENVNSLVKENEIKTVEFNYLMLDFHILELFTKFNVINKDVVLRLLDSIRLFNEEKPFDFTLMEEELLELSTNPDTKFLFKENSCNCHIFKGISAGESGNDLDELPETYSSALNLFN